MNTLTDILPATKPRSFCYVGIYTFLLLLLWRLISGVVIPYISEMIPIRLFLWINEHLAVQIGLFATVLAGIYLYTLVDRTSTLSVTRVYVNNLHPTNRGVCYGAGWAIGNIFEKFVTTFESFAVTEEVPKDKPLEAKALDDTPRIWGTYIFTILDATVLRYSLETDKILEAIKAISKTEIKTLIESFTHNRPSDQILGHGSEITTHVMNELNNRPSIHGQGFRVEWITGDMDESIDAAKARVELKKAEQLSRALDVIQSKDSDLYDKNGNVKRGALTREEAAAVLIARDKDARGEYGRKVDERVLRIEGDPELIKTLKGTGLLMGLGHEHEQNAQT